MPPVVAGTASAGDILALVRSGRVRTRRELQELTGLSRSTLTQRMTQLTAAGYITESGQVAGGAGRPAKIVSFDEDGQLIVAVDLGATHAHLAVVAGSGRVIIEATNAVRFDSPPDDELRSLARRITDLIARSGRTLHAVAGVGIGIPGPVRFTTQRPNMPPLMPGWHDIPIAERLSAMTDLPVFLDNDANLMGLGEQRARYPDVPSVLFVKVGTGIGAGVILDGQPERGTAGGAGDIGHIRVVDGAGGHRCSCGAYGCLATEASGGALARQLTERGREISSVQQVADLISAGDAMATELAERAGHLLGDVLATSIALLNPTALVLGGIIPAAGPQLLAAVRERVFQRTVPLATRELTIASSSLGSGAAVEGARHLVIDQTFSAAAVDARLAAAATT